MVRYSKLAFRETVAQYGVDLCWTPMTSQPPHLRPNHRPIRRLFSPGNLPLNHPPRPYVNGVDINCGCPQSWACACSIGAALMHKRELVAEMVKEAKSALKRDGFEGKKTVRETIDFINTVQDAGVDFITIHGRMRSTPSSHPVNLEAIKLLTTHTTVPTLSNGDIFTLSDAFHHTSHTGVSGVMSARGLLENPALFAGYASTPGNA
ncbi:putative trna dihydrouridine synthase [Botrytis cinerea]